MPFNRTDDRILPELEEIRSGLRNVVFYNKTFFTCQLFFENLGVPFRYKRTKAEALFNSLGTSERRIADFDFPAFSTEDRAMIVETLTALKGTLDEALDRAAKGGKILA